MRRVGAKIEVVSEGAETFCCLRMTVICPLRCGSDRKNQNVYLLLKRNESFRPFGSSCRMR